MLVFIVVWTVKLSLSYYELFNLEADKTKFASYKSISNVTKRKEHIMLPTWICRVPSVVIFELVWVVSFSVNTANNRALVDILKLGGPYLYFVEGSIWSDKIFLVSPSFLTTTDPGCVHTLVSLPINRRLRALPSWLWYLRQLHTRSRNERIWTLEPPLR